MRISDALTIDLTEILHVLWSADDVVFTSTIHSGDFHRHLFAIETKFRNLRRQEPFSPTLPIGRLADEPFRSRFVELQNQLIHLREAGGQLDLLILRAPSTCRYVVFAQILASAEPGRIAAIQEELAALMSPFSVGLSDGGAA